jgi:MFS family permease
VRSKSFQVNLIYIISLFGELCYNIILLVSILYGTKIGGTTIEIGWIGGIYGLSYMLLTPVFGKLVKKIGTKRSFLISFLGQIGCSLYFLIWARSISSLIIGHFLFGMINALYWPAIEGSVSTMNEHSEKSHQRAFFNYSLCWTLGIALASFFGGYLADLNYILGFLIPLVIYIVEFCLILIFFTTITPKTNITSELSQPIQDEKRNNSLKKQQQPEQQPQQQENITLKKWVVPSILGISLLNTMVVKLLLSYYPNYASLPTGLNWTGTLTGQVLFGFGLGRVLFFIFGRKLKLKYAYISISLTFLGIITLLISFIIQPFISFILLLLSGCCIALIYLTSIEFLLKYEKKEKAGKAGLFQSVLGIGIALSPVLAGYLATTSLIYPFLFYGIGILAVGVVIFLSTRNPIFKENP